MVMTNRSLYILLLLLVCFVSAFAQFLLKISSQKQYCSIVFSYLNVYVLSAYGLFFSCLVANVFLLRYLPVSTVSALSESLPLVFSFINGRIFFCEKLTVPKIAGGITIIVGTIVIVL